MKTRIALPSWSCFLLLISKFLIVCDLQGQELWINGSAANNDVNYVTNGFVNFGTIRMESTDGAYASDLTVTSGALTNAASGVVNINIGSGGERVIAASMLNLGAFNANDSMAFSQSNASIANSGQFNIASGATVSINGDGQVFNQNGGALTNGGGMELNGAQFNFNGGVIAGNPLYLLNSALNISPSSSNSPGSFIVTGGGGTYGGDLWPGQAIWIQGNQTGGHTVLTSATGFNNSGSILLESGDAGYESSLAVLNGVLINTVPGVINILAGTGGVRNVDANFINYGAFNVSNSLGISYTNGVYDNEGAFEVASDAVVTINGENQTFIQGSGGPFSASVDRRPGAPAA